MDFRAIIVAGMELCSSAFCHARIINTSDIEDDFDAFVSSITMDFDNFREQILSNYAEFIRNPWKEFKQTEAVPNPNPIPTVPPVVIDEENLPPIKTLPVVVDEPINPIETLPTIDPLEQPQPVLPIETSPEQKTRMLDFTLFGTPMSVRVTSDFGKSPLVKGVSENAIADAFVRLSDKANDVTVADCLRLRKELDLSDWAYLQLLRTLGKEATTSNNDAALLTAYLYMQSGYKMRLANNGSDLYLLYASRHFIYDKPFYVIDGYNYYALEPIPMKLLICPASFPQEQPLSLKIPKAQKFAIDKAQSRTRTSVKYPYFTTTTTANKNLMDFYSTYPSSSINDDTMTRWSLKADTPLDDFLKDQLYPTIRKHLSGKSNLEALEILLNYVQTGFEYEYDERIWGTDRAFFAEETLNYPFCDCEDRAILLTILVRDILGNECLLVYYPGHMACAIEMPDNSAPGEYLIVDGVYYIIADPTFINARLGKTMRGMDNKTAKVIKLEN